MIGCICCLGSNTTIQDVVLMRCPWCASFNNKVIDKRTVKLSGETRRRRECLKCHQRFTTYERVLGLELSVVKKSGKLEAYDKEKIRQGIAKALEKRPGLDRAAELADKIDRKIKAQHKAQIPTKIIGRMVLLELKKLDKVAYLRFASVYRQFANAGDFAKELSSLGTNL